MQFTHEKIYPPHFNNGAVFRCATISRSGVLNVFFDRMTDLLDDNKELGRQFRTKKMAVITSSNGNHLSEAFWIPFKATANYLDMQYIGNLHTIDGETIEESIKSFAALIKTTAKSSY